MVNDTICLTQNITTLLETKAEGGTENSLIEQHSYATTPTNDWSRPTTAGTQITLEESNNMITSQIESLSTESRKLDYAVDRLNQVAPQLETLEFASNNVRPFYGPPTKYSRYPVPYASTSSSLMQVVNTYNLSLPQTKSQTTFFTTLTILLPVLFLVVNDRIFNRNTYM